MYNHPYIVMHKQAEFNYGDEMQRAMLRESMRGAMNPNSGGLTPLQSRTLFMKQLTPMERDIYQAEENRLQREEQRANTEGLGIALGGMAGGAGAGFLAHKLLGSSAINKAMRGSVPWLAGGLGAIAGGLAGYGLTR
jgi:hypothetical protein